MGAAYIMMAPWEVILPRQLWIVLLSLPIMGLGESMVFSKIYLVPIYPHMIRTATEDYGYAKDDILIDNLSALCNIACNTGEIIGPLFSGTVSEMIGFENSSALVALACFIYTGIYFFGSGLFSKWVSKDKENLIKLKLVYVEDNA